MTLYPLNSFQVTCSNLSLFDKASAWFEGHFVNIEMTEGSSLIDKVFGVFSGVFLICSVVSLVDKGMELLQGSNDTLRKQFWGEYTCFKLGSDIVRDLASSISSSFYIANALRDFSWVRSRLWSYNVLNAVAGCFGVIASGCEIASQVHSIKVIDSMLKKKISLLKESFLKEHRKEAIYTIASSVANIALIALFTIHAFYSAPALLAVALVLFVVTAPVQYLTIAQKMHNYFLHKSQNACCKMLA